MKRIAICKNNKGHEDTILPYTAYTVINDLFIEEFDLIRIIDENSEDCVYDINHFTIHKVEGEDLNITDINNEEFKEYENIDANSTLKPI